MSNKILNYSCRILRYFYRLKLKNTDFSLITNNCIGGIISHDMHLKFLSPTVNLFFDDAEFITFLENFDEYIQLPVVEYIDDRYDYPLGVLNGSAGSLRIFFMHYKTFEEAAEKWNQRKNRVNKNNMFVIMEGNSCNDELLMRFDRLEIKNKVVLTDGVHDDVRHSFPVLGDFYGGGYWHGKILEFPEKGLHRYLECFDYVEFFNSGKIRRRHV